MAALRRVGRAWAVCLILLAPLYTTLLHAPACRQDVPGRSPRHPAPRSASAAVRWCRGPTHRPVSSVQVVSLHCNLDDNTRHLINAQRLALMKPDAVLVNAARGPCIDEAALVAHLKANPNFRAGAHAGAGQGGAGQGREARSALQGCSALHGCRPSRVGTAPPCWPVLRPGPGSEVCMQMQPGS